MKKQISLILFIGFLTACNQVDNKPLLTDVNDNPVWIKIFGFCLD